MKTGRASVRHGVIDQIAQHATEENRPALQRRPAALAERHRRACLGVVLDEVFDEHGGVELLRGFR